LATILNDINRQAIQPTTILSMRRWDAYKMFSKIQKELHRRDPRDPKVSAIVQRLAQPAPTGHFLVVAIYKGKQIAALPCPDTRA
jgi:hypothetical protein